MLGQLHGGRIDPCQAAHWALSLGLDQAVRQRLEAPKGRAQLSAEQRRGLGFRIARTTEPFVAHQHLLAPSRQRELQSRWKRLRKNSSPIRVALHGGIGDHLQDLSALVPWLRDQHQAFMVHFESGRMAQFDRLLKSIAPEGEITCEALFRDEGLHVLEALALLGTQVLQPRAWIDLQRPQHTPFQLLCCWGAIGQGDRFSAWSRSVPFAAVQRLYDDLLGHGWPAAAIVDITAWKPWEAATLRQLGVQLVNPAAGDVLDLAQLVNRCQQVVSIDTALVHLCAAMGQPVHLLLPRFYDERWFELLQPGSSYAACCQVLRQETFGNWESELRALRAGLCPAGP